MGLETRLIILVPRPHINKAHLYTNFIMLALNLKTQSNYLIVAASRLVGRRSVSYVQGQSSSPNVREYFYYIDHHGQLFLHDTKVKNFVTCFKDKKFLAFFFKRLKVNTTDKYEEFPYMSPCGRELNYIQCEDKPIVYYSIINSADNTTEVLTMNGAENQLTSPFQPEKICMFPQTGRIYHPTDQKYGGIGLIKSSLGIEISPGFEFKDRNNETDPPSHFHWKGKLYELDNSLWRCINE